jgi:hypothetical protein
MQGSCAIDLRAWLWPSEAWGICIYGLFIPSLDFDSSVDAMVLHPQLADSAFQSFDTGRRVSIITFDLRSFIR